MGVAVVYKGFVYSFVSEGIAWELGDKLSIIHCLYRLALSITRPSSSFSQRKAEKKHSAELSPVCGNYFQQPPSTVQARRLNISSHQVGQMISHGATPFFKKAQLTVITLAKKSVALRHWPVGKYLYASFKRRPLTGLWKRRTAAQEKLRVLTRVLCTNVALFPPSFVRRLEGAQEGSPGALLHWSSIIYPGPLSVLKIRLIRVKRDRFIIIGN